MCYPLGIVMFTGHYLLFLSQISKLSFSLVFSVYYWMHEFNLFYHDIIFKLCCKKQKQKTKTIMFNTIASPSVKKFHRKSNSNTHIVNVRTYEYFSEKKEQRTLWYEKKLIENVRKSISWRKSDFEMRFIGEECSLQEYSWQEMNQLQRMLSVYYRDILATYAPLRNVPRNILSNVLSNILSNVSRNVLQSYVLWRDGTDSV